MIPSAKIAIRPRPPPENRFSRPRMLLPPKLLWICLTAAELIPGAGMCVPSRYSASRAAVKSSLLRISLTLNAPRIVEIMTASVLRGLGLCDRVSGDHAVPPCGFDPLPRRLAKRVRVDGQRLGQIALGQHLDRD